MLLLRLEETLFLTLCRGFKGFFDWLGTPARGQVFLIPCTLRLVSLLLHDCLALVIVLIGAHLAISIIFNIVDDIESVPVSPLAVLLDLHGRRVIAPAHAHEAFLLSGHGLLPCLVQVPP